MSRTWKDRPHWVMINDPDFNRTEERHFHYRDACNLSDTAVPGHVRRGMRKFNCQIYVRYDKTPISAMDTHLFWWKTDRARARNAMHDFVKDYNANDDIEEGDYDYFNKSHRHNAMWYYW